LGSWKRVADTTHLVGTDRPRGLGGRSSKHSQATQVCPVPILRKLRRPPRPSTRPLQPPRGNPSRRRVGRLAKAGNRRPPGRLIRTGACRVDLTLQMTVGEEFARHECGNGGAAASIVPPTIPSRLGRAADRPRWRPMPSRASPPANHLHRRRPVVRVGPWPGGPHPVTGPGAGGDPAATGISRRGFSRTRAPTARSVAWCSTSTQCA
jgi:hypothetical protein